MVNNIPEEGIDYSFIETDDPLVTQRSRNPILSIHREDYPGVIVQFGKIKFLPDEVPPRMSFDFTVLNPGDHYTKEALDKDPVFKNFLGDIIVSTIETTYREQHESRNRNSERLD